MSTRFYSRFFLALGSNRVFTEGTCKLLTLVVTDLVDEDLVLNHRKQAASALLFGMVALVTKPGQTFAPLLGTWLLCFYTGEACGAQLACTSSGSSDGDRRLCLGLCCLGMLSLAGPPLRFFLSETIHSTNQRRPV